MHIRRILAVALALLAARLPAAPLALEQIDCLAATHRALKSQLAEMNEYFGVPAPLARYEREYRDALRAGTTEVTPVETMGPRLESARLVLLGDTHTELESQLNTVEVLRTMQAGPGPVSLVIEWIDRSFQDEVDAFLAGELTPGALRAAVEYDTHWSFSWEHYLPILEAARDQGAGVLLVENHRERQELDARDRDIVEWTLAHRAAHPETRYLVVYGSYHVLGEGHLPDLFEEGGHPADAVVVGEGPEVYYQALRKVGDPDLLRYVRLGEGLYFIRNGTPVERERESRDRFMGYSGWREEDFRDQVPDCDATHPYQRRFRQLHRSLD